MGKLGKTDELESFPYLGEDERERFRERNLMVSLVIPTFNERDNIGGLIKSVYRVLQEGNAPFEVIVVDDDSPDGTWEAVEGMVAEYGNLRIIRRANERGLARAVARGWQAARGEILAVMDGDLQHPPETLAGLIKAIKERGVDIAVGSRHVKGGGVSEWSIIRRGMSWAATLVATWILPGLLATIRDPMSGYFALRRSVIENCRLEPEGYKILLEVLARGQYRTVEEVPYTFRERAQGGSKLGLRQYFEFLMHLIRLSWETGELTRLLKFCIVGGSGVFVNMGVLAALTSTGMWYVKAGIMGVETAIVTNFLLNEFWSFSDFSRRRKKLSDRIKRLITFNLLCAGGALINLAVLWTLTHYAGVHYLISNLVGIGVATLWNYGMNANITWESSRTQKRDEVSVSLNASEPISTPTRGNRPSSSRYYDTTAVALCVTSLVLALIIGHFRQVGNFGVETDFYGNYVIQARNILGGMPYTHPFHPPGYPLLLAFVSLLTGDFFLAGKILTASATAVFGWCIYVLIKAVFDCRIAFASLGLSLLALIPFSFIAATDMVGALLFTVPLVILLRRPTVATHACALAGVFAGLAYLVRTNGAFVIIGIVIALLCIDPNRDTLRKRGITSGAFICGVLLITVPWLVLNWKSNGSPFASANYLQVAAHFHLGGKDGLVTSLRQAWVSFKSPLDVLMYDPLTMLKKYLWFVGYKNIDMLLREGMGFPAYVFAGGGLVLLLGDLRRRRVFLICVLSLGYLLLGLVGFQLRFYLFLYPLLFLLVPYFLFHEAVAAFLRRARFSPSVVSWSIIVIIAGFLGVQAYRESVRTLSSEPRYLFEVAKVLKEHSLPTDALIARKPHLAYLAGRRSVFPMAETAEEFVALARELGVRYIVYDELGERLWTGLGSLKDPEKVPRELKVVYRHDRYHTILYEVSR